MFQSASTTALHQINAALQHIIVAVKCDSDGDYAKAIPSYRKGVAIMKKNMPFAPEKYREALALKISEYESRLMIIEPLDVIDLSTPPEVNSPMRPFWLIKSLEGTTTQGAFLTSSREVFIPRVVWVQNGVKVPGLQLKLDTCALLSDILQQLSLMDVAEVDNASMVKELDSVINQLVAVQNRLSMSLSYIHEIPETKKAPEATQVGRFSNKLQAIGHLVQKQASRIQTTLMATKLQHDSSYVEAASQLFETCQFLVDWIKYFEVNPDPNGEILSRLHRISSFFHDCLCHFVMHDFSMMLSKYLEARRKAFLMGDM
eukprot:TRINITY_DN2979_c0_g1_i10.p1 TRINITY_DN2979_c0_g1~~TRINITY_DN2979_c0_g1_i10.p1  ORF type:complete len:316 (+),score=71.90 TRINITY_DN2979_c0_g1_i10:45-992(+)